MVALLALASYEVKGLKYAQIKATNPRVIAMDELEWSKIVGGLCGALLLYMVTNTLAGTLYHVGGDDGHHGGKAHASESKLPASIYVLEDDTGAIAVADAGTESKAEENAGATVVADADDKSDLEEFLAGADVKKGKKVFSKCKACHKLDEGKNGVGPNLYQIIDRPIGSVAGYDYSGAMKDFGGNWDIATLDAFLAKPKKFMSGTKMSFAGLKKEKDRVNIIAYLQSLQ